MGRLATVRDRGGCGELEGRSRAVSLLLHLSYALVCNVTAGLTRLLLYRYLGVDKFGILSATREAISPEEQFTVLPSPDTPGTFALQTRRDKFVCISAPTTPIKSKKSNTDTTAPPTDIRGDADTIDFNSTLRIRMQARFKPRNRAHKEAKAREKISRKELEEMVGRKLQDEEVRKLKRARREGDFHEMVLDARTKGKHDKFA